MKFPTYPSGVFDDTTCKHHGTTECVSVNGLGRCVCTENGLPC